MRRSRSESPGPTEPQGEESDPSPPRSQKLLAQEEATWTNWKVACPQLEGASVGVRWLNTPSAGEPRLNEGKEPNAGEMGEIELPLVPPPPHQRT
jgi:hypothetical protein